MSTPTLPACPSTGTAARSGTSRSGPPVGLRPQRRVRVEPGWQPRWELPGPPVRESHLALAQDYQRRTTLFPGWREHLVTRLAPRRGDTVIDVGCGPGLNLAALRAAVGPAGTIIGIEESPELLTVAAARVVRRRWDNVELINAPIATAQLSAHAGAALFAAAHDVVADPAAVTNVVGQLRPGARVAAGGWKSPSSPWLWPLRVWVTAWQRPQVTDFTGLDQPWRLLSAHVGGLRVHEIGFGTGYLAHSPYPGTRRPPAPAQRSGKTSA